MLQFFLFLIVITILYHIDGDAHQYYNTGPYWNNIHGFFSLVIIILFGLYFWFCILFPFIWIIQAILMGRFNIFRKRLGLNFLVILLCLGAVVALFSLYSIGEHRRFIEKRNTNGVILLRDGVWGHTRLSNQPFGISNPFLKTTKHLLTEQNLKQ